jgi:5-methyltetrahydropteroyltriglutamate--homocysteine methyltransferase
MPEIISDDIGSFPLPAAADREKLRETASKIAAGESTKGGRAPFDQVIDQMMQRKIDSGIMRPNYPQVTDMISFYQRLLEEHSEQDEPWLIQKKHAVVPELSALDSAGKRFLNETGEPLRIRVCVTGPLELYLKIAGGNVQEDLLMNIAKSISRFVENSIIDTSYLKTSVFSIDEPSLGLNPNLAIDPDILADAWEIVTKKTGRRDVEMHLHSVNSVDMLYPVAKINVIGVEYAASPKALELLDKSEIESYDKFLRVGVARTDISKMVAEYNEAYSVDLWKTREFPGLTEKMENVRNITKRLKKAYGLFGDRIKYAGPDCGLGSWPDQDVAYSILKNAADAIDGLNGNSRIR